MPAKNASAQAIRRRFTITGQVQGVGFRPFVFRLARDNRLTGTVRNGPEGVVIEAQGPAARMEAFGRALRRDAPPLSRIVGLMAEDIPAVEAEDGFRIVASASGQGHAVLISPDTAACADCLADMADPANRRQRYPFTNCTNCGPRYTITRSIPYDRPFTSMACFALCARCRAEYGDPLDRRFHAQPNACPECGPRVWLAGKDGREAAQKDDALRRLAELLAGGAVCAVKGLGGFHLACNAADPDAVRTLRRRKNRQSKPLAIMAASLGAARRLAHVSDAEAALLAGRERPIVLLPRRADAPLAAELAPDTRLIGVMLPYTPLHHVLFEHLRELGAGHADVPALVMTSGNLSSEPICLGNREALARLAAIADWFLLHDRDILIRTDDSVLRVLPDGATQFLRRARGYTPSPIFLSAVDGDPGTVLGLGPELKNTLCLTKGSQAFVSQHIGDLQNLETLGFWREIKDHLAAILQVRPVLAVRDLHPDYLTSQWAAGQGDLPVAAVQHHVAHVWSVLAEHALDGPDCGPTLGLALDGTGYGEDGTLWGGEALLVNPADLSHRRVGHLAQVRLPGGEAAIREPWRVAQSHLHSLGLTLEDAPAARPWPWLEPFGPASRLVDAMLRKGLNSPLSSSCGRLFDAVAALLGLALTVDYEGQAAIRLEQAQDMDETAAYPCPVITPANGGPLVLDTLALFSAVYADAQAGMQPGRISRRFHLGLASGLADLATQLAAQTGASRVALSGGCLHNATLAVELPRLLSVRGLAALSHRHVPPGDGCISLGQAAWGRRAVERESKK